MTTNRSAVLNWRDSGGDLLGVALLAGCVIHCLAAPSLIALSPWLAGEASESLFMSATCAVGLLVLALGIRRHGELAPLLLGSLGLAGCLFGGEGLKLGGALVLGVAHLLNARASCRCAAGCQLEPAAPAEERGAALECAQVLEG